MLVTLNTPYTDTTAADLSFALGLAEQPALHVLDLVVTAGAALRLRLLGTSHQIVLRAPGRELVETVACLPGHPGDLPSIVDDQPGYRFTARVSRLDFPVMAERVDQLRRDLAPDPAALVGVFPGSPYAVTALHVRRGDDFGRAAGGVPTGHATIGWRTWHCYPETAELVETETEVMW